MSRRAGRGRSRFDAPGAGLATLALGALTWALTLWSSTHRMTAESWSALVIGLVALAAFLWTEHRRGERAMMPLALFGSRAFVGLTLLTFLLYGALGGLILLLPFLLIVAGAYTPVQAGLALLPFSVVIGTASRLAGRLTERVGPRWPLSIGPLVTAAGFALLVRADPNASYWTSIFPGMAVIALGMAGAVAPLTTAVLGSVDAKHTGTASGFNSAIARTGGLIATAVSGAVLAMRGQALVDAFHGAALVGGGAGGGIGGGRVPDAGRASADAVNSGVAATGGADRTDRRRETHCPTKPK